MNDINEGNQLQSVMKRLQKKLKTKRIKKVKEKLGLVLIGHPLSNIVRDTGLKGRVRKG